MLETKDVCERCAEALPADAAAALCSHEYSLCPACSETVDHRCPNCSGELVVHRPHRVEP